jgi:hypothetical protein
VHEGSTILSLSFSRNCFPEPPNDDNSAIIFPAVKPTGEPQTFEQLMQGFADIESRANKATKRALAGIAPSVGEPPMQGVWA